MEEQTLLVVFLDTAVDMFPKELVHFYVKLRQVNTPVLLFFYFRVKPNKLF